MLLEAFGFPLKSKKPDEKLIKSVVRLKRQSMAPLDEEKSAEENEEAEKKKSGTLAKLFIKIIF